MVILWSLLVCLRFVSWKWVLWNYFYGFMNRDCDTIILITPCRLILCWHILHGGSWHLMLLKWAGRCERPPDVYLLSTSMSINITQLRDPGLSSYKWTPEIYNNCGYHDTLYTVTMPESSCCPLAQHVADVSALRYPRPHVETQLKVDFLGMALSPCVDKTIFL